MLQFNIWRVACFLPHASQSLNPRHCLKYFFFPFQKIQKSCQGPTQSLVSSWNKSSVGGSSRGSAKTQSRPPRTPRRKSDRLAAVSTPTSDTRIVSPSGKRSPFQPGSCRLNKELLPLRRSMRAAALRSPYGSPASVRQRRQVEEKSASC